MKQEHEMTPGVLVSGDDMSAGDYKARCAVLEDELAELRKRACVPDGHVVVSVEPSDGHLDSMAMRMRHDFGLLPEYLKARFRSDARQLYEECTGQGFYKLAAPAPAERNQCDGCQAGIPVENGMHRTGKPGGYSDLMVCTADRYGAAPVERVEKEAEDLDSRLRAAGMYSVADLLRGAPLDGFIKHAGVHDIESLVKWAEMRRAECLRAMTRYDLGEKPEGDDLYEWTVAHCAAFTELHVNLRAAITTPQPAPTAAQDVAGLLNRIVPRIDAGGPNPINPDIHCCEWTLHKERERIHAEFADALAQHGEDNN